MRDLLYYYDKTSFKQYEFGEIQTGFNMSFVIDGTKDSCKVSVYSYQEKEITPNTIVWHKATNTWWIVANDKTSRYENESGYLYTHELQLEGAIELLNARDLTDSGFNSNRYNVEQFIERLFNHSNFEYNIRIEYNSNLSSNKNIDYIKTFENYTLLSALREFLDGYNCVAKLSFETTTQGNDIILNNAVISIISKTGNANVLSRNADDVFNDIREIRNNNKSSYGTSVISNAENVVSTKAKTYPSVGGVKLASNNGMAVTGQNAILLLPSNVFKANYIDICWSRVPYGYVTWSGNTSTVHYLGYFDASNPESIQNAYDTYIETLEQEEIDTSSVSIDQFTKYACRIYYCDNYDAVNNNFISEYPIQTANIHNPNHASVQYVLTSKELKETNTYTQRAICFERGKNYISGFDAFSGGSGGNSLELTSATTSTIYKLIGTNNRLVAFVGAISVNGNQVSATYPSIDIKYASFIVNYIPMSDIKIKMDNYGDTIDSVLYNQNGKLNDSNSLSKVLISYSKEIESDTITRYGTYYGGYVEDLGFQNGGLPSVGDLIIVDNEYYVINNISIDFNPNESVGWLVDSIGYYMTAEVSLSKKVATKSMLTNPNTNIRDYGIPQNNNVKRKQLYRDFFELDYTSSGNSDWYQSLSNILDLSTQPNQYKEHIALIHTHFENSINGSKDYYYQLETTTYFLKKSIYEIVDFKDNNIIGYGYQNIWSGFDISKILSGVDSLVDLYTIPISYVDNLGEIKGIRIKLAKVDNIKDSYDAYLSTTQYSSSDVSIYNASVFIPSNIYTYLTSGKYDFLIEEDNYCKDALEVPVFEYSAQIDDTDNVVIGSNIFDNFEDDSCYAYAFVLVNKGYYDDNNYELTNIPTFILQRNLCLYTNAVKLEYNDNSEILIRLFNNATVNVETGSVSWGTEKDLDTIDFENKDLIIVRHTITIDDMPNHYTLFFQFNEGIESIYYSIDNGLTFRTLLNNYQIDVLANDSVYWYASPLFGYELDYGVPDSEINAEEVIVDENKTIAPTTTKITYQLNGISTNGTVLWYPDRAYIVGTEITQADYGDEVYYKIVADTGYDLPQNYIGSLVVNAMDFNFSGVNTATHTFDPCTIQSFNVLLNVGTGATLYYSLNEGVSFTSVINNTSINVNYGTRIWWYATIDSNSHYNLDSSVPNGYANARLVVIDSAITLNASTYPKTYTLLPDSVSNGTINWYPNSAYVSGTEISSADYGTTVYYQINANSGYSVGGSTYARGSKTINTTDFTFNESNNTATAKSLPSISINTYSVVINKGTGILRIRYQYTGQNWTWSYNTISLTLPYNTNFYWYAEVMSGYSPSSGTPTSEENADHILVQSNVEKTASATQTVLASVSCSGIGSKNASVYVNATTGTAITVTQVVVYYGALSRVIFSGSQYISGYGGYTFTGTTTINLSDGDYAVVSLSNGQTVYGYF